eukprot:gene14259-biopygen21626
MGRGLRAVGRGRAGWRKINLPGGAGGGGRGGGPFFSLFSAGGASVPRGHSLLRRDANRRARAPGAQMIRLASGSSLAFQRRSRPTL